MPWFAFTIVIFCIFFVIAPAVPSSPLLPSSGAGLPAACPLSLPPLVAWAAYCPPHAASAQGLGSVPTGLAGRAPPAHPLIRRCVCVLREGVWSPHGQTPDLGPRLL